MTQNGKFQIGQWVECVNDDDAVLPTRTAMRELLIKGEVYCVRWVGWLPGLLSNYDAIKLEGIHRKDDKAFEAKRFKIVGR